MAAPFISDLLGRRKGKAGYPNICDKDSEQSVSISEHILGSLSLPTPDFTPSNSPGTKLEHAIEKHLGSELPKLNAGADWDVRSKQNPISTFEQYSHLADLSDAIDQDETGTLRVVVGGDYLVKPDVTIGVGAPKRLHASVSCKWTLRSDRAQNARTEARGLLSHRKGRAPHIVVVTAEPLPSRLASLGFGTGDIDAVYHIAYEELLQAVDDVGNGAESSSLDVMVRGKRLLDYNTLAPLLAMS